MSILSCRVCGASPKPILFKSGRRRGEIKHRGVISCVELADRFVRIHGHITLGCCAGCFAAHAALLAAHLAGVRAEVPGSLSVPGRWERRRCTAVEMVIEQDAGGRR